MVSLIYFYMKCGLFYGINYRQRRHKKSLKIPLVSCFLLFYITHVNNDAVFSTQSRASVNGYIYRQTDLFAVVQSNYCAVYIVHLTFFKIIYMLLGSRWQCDVLVVRYLSSVSAAQKVGLKYYSYWLSNFCSCSGVERIISKLIYTLFMCVVYEEVFPMF